MSVNKTDYKMKSSSYYVTDRGFWNVLLVHSTSRKLSTLTAFHPNVYLSVKTAGTFSRRIYSPLTPRICTH